MNMIKGNLVSGRETIITTRIKDGEVHQTCGFNEGSLTPQEREELVVLIARAMCVEPDRHDTPNDKKPVWEYCRSEGNAVLDALLERYELRRK